MKKINLSKLNSINFEKKKISNNEEKKLTQEKQIEASALDTMSNYGKAAMYLSCKGKIDEKPLSKDEKRETLKQLTSRRRDNSMWPLFTNEEIEQIIQDDEMYAKVIVLSDIKDSDGRRIFQGYDVFDIINNNEIVIDDNFKKRAIELANVKNTHGERVFEGCNIKNIADNEEKYKRAFELLDIKDINDRMLYDGFDISDMVNDEEKYERVFDLLDIKNTDGNTVFSGYDIINIASNKNIIIDDDFKKRAIELSNIKNSNDRRLFNGLDISDMANDEEKYKRAFDLLDIKNTDGKTVFYGHDIINIASNKNIVIDDDFKKRAIELSNIKGADNRGVFSGFDISDIASDEETYNRALALSGIRNTFGDTIFQGYDIANIARDKETCNKVFTLSNIKHANGMLLFDRYHIFDILEDEEIYNRVLNLSSIKDMDGMLPFSGDEIKNIASNKNIVIDNKFKKRVIELLDIEDTDGIRILNKNNIIDMAQDEKKTKRALNLFENGVNTDKILDAAYSADTYKELMEKINSEPNQTRNFINSASYSAFIKKTTQGRYQKELIDMLDKGTISPSTKRSLISSGLSEEQLSEAIKKLSKSTYKLAMNTPNQYLSGIDTEYTTLDFNGKFPTLEGEDLVQQQKQITRFFSKHIGQITRALYYLDTDTVNQMMDKRMDTFEAELEDLNKLTDENYTLLSKLIKGKSENASGDTLKDLTAKDKIQLCQIVEICQKMKIDVTELEQMADSGRVNMNAIKQIIEKNVLKVAGITDEQLKNIPNDKLKLNQEYSFSVLNLHKELNEAKNAKAINQEARMTPKEAAKKALAELRNMDNEDLEDMIKQINLYIDNARADGNLSSNKEYFNLLLRTLDMYKHLDRYTDDEILEVLVKGISMETSPNIINKATRNSSNCTCETDPTATYTALRESVLGDFNQFINDDSNIYGKTNAKTKQDFKKSGLNYDKWMSPDIDDVKLDVAGKKLTIKMWDRNPQEDLFIGNKTNCCTAIGDGTNCCATGVYLLNTAFNVVELYDDNGNAVGMSRVFMSKIDGKPALIMDNYEINQALIKDMTTEEKNQIRDGFFKYMNQYAKQVTGNDDTQVYFYTEGDGDRFSTDDLSIKHLNSDFIGNISQEKVYMNCSGYLWVDPKRMESLGITQYALVPKDK